MFELMLRELLLKMVREDTEFRDSVSIAVNNAIENDDLVQDAIRKQATTDISELIIDMFDSSQSIDEILTKKIVDVIENNKEVVNSISEHVDHLVDELTFEVTVR